MLAFQGADRAFDLLHEGFGEVGGVLGEPSTTAAPARNPCQATSVRGRITGLGTTSP
jgi:hypothetical protein